MSDADAPTASAPDNGEGVHDAGRVLIIGVGVMGETVLGGLRRAGWPGGSISLVVRRPERADALRERYGVEVRGDLSDVANADVVVVAVKPPDVAGVLDQVAPQLKPDAVVVSLAAGLTTANLEAHLPQGASVVRVMPNTPSQVGEGMAVVSPGANVASEQVERVLQMMRAVGQAVEIPEKYQDAATAVSGSGPAYLFLVAEAMIEAGVHLGLPRVTATELAVQTLHGSARLLRESGEHPALLREQVTSPGGTTSAALRTLEDHGLRAAFLDAMAAARHRSGELASGS